MGASLRFVVLGIGIGGGLVAFACGGASSSPLLGSPDGSDSGAASSGAPGASSTSSSSSSSSSSSGSPTDGGDDGGGDASGGTLITCGTDTSCDVSGDNVCCEGGNSIVTPPACEAASSCTTNAFKCLAKGDCPDGDYCCEDLRSDSGVSDTQTSACTATQCATAKQLCRHANECASGNCVLPPNGGPGHCSG